ncbi:MAG: O-antigen ligase family protein, partial [Pseudomonadota bacterium]
MDIPIHWDVIRRRIRGYALPLFLFLAMAIGGATRSIPISIALLQVVSCGLLAWVIFDSSLNSLRPRAWAMVFIFVAFLGYAILQLIPLPSALWTQLPGRDEVANAFDLIGAAPRAMPISLTPQVSLAALLQLVPAVAVFLLAAKLRWSEMSRHVEWSIPLVACISVFVGLAQIQYPEVDALYVRNEVVRGQAMGLMQVVNHNATLMLISIPFLALAAKRLAIRFAIGDPDHAASIFVALMFATITVGVVATGSVAGYLLAPPTMFLSLFVLQSQQSGMAFKVLSLFAASLITIIVFLVVNNPNLSGIGVTDLSQSPLSRLSIYENTLEAIKDHLPWGTGIGSFGSIYPSYENLDEITQAFIASA